MGLALKLKADQALLLLLVFVPITLVLEYVFHASGTTLFLTSAVAIVPLAGIMGKSTEMLAEHVGAGLGGLLNATFGNAAELIIAIFALRAGLYDLVKASLTGSIIGNILLIFGLSALLGGLKFRKQVFNRTAAKLGSTLLLLSAVGLVIPSLLHFLRDGAESGAASGAASGTAAATGAGAGSGSLSLEISVVLIVCYILSLVFALRTHAELYQGTAHAGGETHAAAAWSKGKSFAILAGAAALVGWMSEILVGGAEEAAHALGMTEVFVGVIVVALVGNAAEHSTAVLVALRNKMDLSIQIAVGSSLQIALFIAPLLVFLSYAIGPAPMDLVFSPLEVVAVAVSVLVVGQIADDGQTHWMEGVLLLAVYVVLGFAFFNLPG